MQCRPEHFGNTERSLQLFNTWAGFSHFCLEVENADKIKFYDEHGELFNKHLTMRAERCVNSTENDNHCQSNDYISDYLKDASLHGWVIQDNIVLRNIDSEPIY